MLDLFAFVSLQHLYKADYAQDELIRVPFIKEEEQQIMSFTFLTLHKLIDRQINFRFLLLNLKSD